ncbi:hypothetical protein HPB48_008411 [Haemaphysalis longicornis]|uniref:Uncharacterized protein n=1 Tax=Haemaphysalis longicornis TaxID=44386 RepID=A0A9J6H1N0_HAELO|nr:hypothetical protein HPB48_008411 [Haemaphysalis longicornis]
MRLCLMLLAALWLCGSEAARVGSPSSAMRRALWWRPEAYLERQVRAGPKAGPTVAKASSLGPAGSVAQSGTKVGAPAAPGEVAHPEAATSSKAQQSVRSPREARQYDVPQIGEFPGGSVFERVKLIFGVAATAFAITYSDLMRKFFSH